MKRGVRRHGLGGYAVLPSERPIRYEDGELDAVWCDSCIEQLALDRASLAKIAARASGIRANEQQQRSGREINCICRNDIGQDMYATSPITAHSWVHDMQYCPNRQRVGIARWLKRIWIKQWTPDFHLYDVRRFREHSPGGARFPVKRVFGIAKSLFAVRNSIGGPRSTEHPHSSRRVGSA